ncbi:MAG: hypothetical protein UU05_C0010G0012 [Candidatus Curtissbacteria bacterium GW2011_GWA1_40_47]|nr:MAG: hypothetical protein UT95_C0019G0017 [Candidatus Curtissbacteria bacterium GW2011_GWB1_40_28]KKR65817.1 MAG: hypothetical protein UU05_C0010G0012 [Candidatus Curtissbacteria bacterium GW2011_GWA1_40_47]
MYSRIFSAGIGLATLYLPASDISLDFNGSIIIFDCSTFISALPCFVSPAFLRIETGMWTWNLGVIVVIVSISIHIVCY